MGEIIKHPSAATSYLTINKAGGFFYVVLVTPGPRKSLKTRLAGFSDLATAIEHGKAGAKRMQRPFREV